jgi:tetratricopeptide (TPR) repeat protein
MRALRHCALLALFVSACAALTFAQEPGMHPAYLHALTDLRHARAHLENLAPTHHMDKEEEHAINEIDKAIEEIKRAAIDDGKNLNDHPPVDARLDRAGRYHRALELLDKAHNDIAREEDDPHVRGLRNRAIGHIDEAHHIVDHLIVQAANY